MQQVYRLVSQCAATNTTVLVTGESGTGKELVARAIHHNSLRRDKAFVAVDCNALSENLLESELFGHVKGSFTGAVANKRGVFEVADGGTLFLDEIGEYRALDPGQAAACIQEREYRAVGDTRTQTANFQAHRGDEQGSQNDDRARHVPRRSLLSDQRIPDRVAPAAGASRGHTGARVSFSEGVSEELGKKVDEISEGALNVLLNYPWPGNVRELENTMHRAVLLATDKVIRKAHLVSLLDADALPEFDVPRTGEELKRVKKEAREKSVEHIEKAFVLEALKRNAWNVTRSAESTGMLRANFQALMKKHGVRLREADRNGEPSRTPECAAVARREQDRS